MAESMGAEVAVGFKDKFGELPELDVVKLGNFVPA